jgi:hypothetical protein
LSVCMASVAASATPYSPFKSRRDLMNGGNQRSSSEVIIELRSS